MTLPRSFAADGFTGIPPSKFRGCLIGTEGAANTGKSEWAMTGPGPGIFLALDKQYRGMLDNPNPPPSRRDDFLIQPFNVPMSQGAGSNQEEALATWKDFFRNYYLKALANPDARTVVVDGDSDGFEMQMLAAFGRITQIPQIQRTDLNAARRVYVARAVQANKVVIMTNKLKKRYDPVWDAAGNPVPDPQKPAEQKREWDGKSYDRQGWNDYEYCYEIQLRHLYSADEHQWGLKILMCKANRELEGFELWGEDCTVAGLLQTVYPQIGLEEWGY